MVKQLALLVILILGIGATVFVIQKATQLNSKAFNVFDFVYSFYATVGDPRFNPNMDMNGDGMINAMDILKDRYAQEATREAEVATDSGTPDNLDNILDDLNQVESSDSAEEEPDVSI